MFKYSIIPQLHHYHPIKYSPLPAEICFPYHDMIDFSYYFRLMNDKLEAAGELEKIPPLIRAEYFYIPRGRIVFHKDTGRYTILHGGLKKRELNKIRKFFCLPKELTD